jgi:hypothetical protein
MRVSGLGMGMLGTAVIMLLVISPVAAFASYSFDLDVWNTQQLADSGDKVTVTIDGADVTFTFVSGGTLSNTFQAMFNIGFDTPDFAGGNSITGVPSGYSLTCGTAAGGGSCTEDGFASNPMAAEYSTNNGGPGHPSTATFTFANSLPLTLDKTTFAVHVTYSGSCSGWVDGALSGSAGSDTGCTPVPEPITMFLGGTGLLTLGYAARKRLFGARITGVA